MSRLWNKLRAQAWPAPRVCTGVELAGDRLVAVRTELIGEEWSVTHVAEERVSFAFFRGAPRAEDVPALAQALERLGGAQRQVQSIQFALPDPAAMFQVFELESIPGTVQERNALARFRLEKEWPPATNTECVTQSLGEDQGRSLMLAMAVDRAWLESLRAACRLAGIMPNVVDMTVCHVFNRLHERLPVETGDGALFVIEPHCWTLLLWDNTTRPSFIRTRWRETATGQTPDHEAIAIEVERLVRAYVLAAPKRNVSGFYVCAADADFSPLATCLDTRMRAPCVRLTLGQGLSFMPGIKEGMLSPGALAAAILRT